MSCMGLKYQLFHLSILFFSVKLNRAPSPHMSTQSLLMGHCHIYRSHELLWKCGSHGSNHISFKDKLACVDARVWSHWMYQARIIEQSQAAELSLGQLWTRKSLHTQATECSLISSTYQRRCIPKGDSNLPFSIKHFNVRTLPEESGF